jgi:hypothetical protein
MNNQFGLLGGQPPGGPPSLGLLGQPQPFMSQPPMVDPAMLEQPPGPGHPGQQPDPVLEQIAALVEQQGAEAMTPEMPPPLPQMPAQAPVAAPQPEQPKQEPPNLLPYDGNRIADEYIARLMMNPAMGATLGGIAPMPGYDPKQAFANWSAGINQPGQPLPHQAYKGPGYGEQLRMEGARAQADEAMRSASRI